MRLSDRQHHSGEHQRGQYHSGEHQRGQQSRVGDHKLGDRPPTPLNSTPAPAPAPTHLTPLQQPAIQEDVEEHSKLRDWLDLSLNHFVPFSLLILSRVFMVFGKVRPEEEVQATLSSLPDEVVETVGVTSLLSEDSVSERRRKLEFLEEEEELIKEEELAKLKESAVIEEDLALKEMNIATAEEAQERARARTIEKQEQLYELSRALAVLASASSVCREREQKRYIFITAW